MTFESKKNEPKLLKPSIYLPKVYYNHKNICHRKYIGLRFVSEVDVH